MTPKERAIKIIKESMGDDLERAMFIWGGHTPEQMKQKHGESGMTCQEILDGYEKDRRERLEALRFVEGA